MDLLHFMKARTRFVRYYYGHTLDPFEKEIRAIENEEPPYVPDFSDDPEPQFMEEWMSAQMGMANSGQVVLSMLSSSLHLYFREWQDRLKVDRGIQMEINSKKKGWLNGYKIAFRQLNLDLSSSGVDLELIEQVVLARNVIQHPTCIVDHTARFSKSDLNKYPNPFFKEFSTHCDDNSNHLTLKPRIFVTREKFEKAVQEIESLCSWLESEYWKT